MEQSHGRMRDVFPADGARALFGAERFRPRHRYVGHQRLTEEIFYEKTFVFVFFAFFVINIYL